MDKKLGTDRGVVVENPMPYAPENIKLSKAQFVEKQKIQREKDLKIREFAKTLDKPEAKAETNDVEKPKGRPKKII